MKLNGHSAVITGGASGLGEGVARALVDKGVKVTVFDLNPERGKALADEIGVTFAMVNVGDPESVKAGFDQARAANGQERILVNCAGISAVYKAAFRDRATGEIRQFPFDEYEKTIRVNLLGTFYCISTAGAGMMTLDPLEDGERGVIVNTASIAAVEGQMGQAAYSASKNGVLGMTLPIARDFMNEGIRCNAILPGSFDTPLLATAPQKIFDALVAMTPFPKRLGRPDEFASLVVQMCENAYFNGENVRLDGATRLAMR